MKSTLKKELNLGREIVKLGSNYRCSDKKSCLFLPDVMSTTSPLMKTAYVFDFELLADSVPGGSRLCVTLNSIISVTYNHSKVNQALRVAWLKEVVLLPLLLVCSTDGDCVKISS